MLFLALKPVEEFRHTPIIPISEKELKEHKEKVAAANRKGYYVEIKKDTIYYYGKFALILTEHFLSHHFLRLSDDRLRFHSDERENNDNQDRDRQVSRHEEQAEGGLRRNEPVRRETTEVAS